MTTDMILSRLEAVKPTGPGRWLARCPAHKDKHPSLSIRKAQDGKTLIHCFTGCSANDVVAAIGLTLSDLFPGDSTDYSNHRERQPFPAMDALRALAFEASIVQIAATDIAKGMALSADDLKRVQLAAGRIHAALGYVGGRVYG